MRDLSEFCCQNPECVDYGKKGIGNLGYHGYTGNKRYRMLRCKTCGSIFSERKGTAFFRLHMPNERALSVWQHLSEGDGIRKTYRLTGVCLDTVSRLAKRAGEHAGAVHDELVRHVQAKEVQFDEMWNFVGKKG